MMRARIKIPNSTLEGPSVYSFLCSAPVLYVLGLDVHSNFVLLEVQEWSKGCGQVCSKISSARSGYLFWFESAVTQKLCSEFAALPVLSKACAKYHFLYHPDRAVRLFRGEM